MYDCVLAHHVHCDCWIAPSASLSVVARCVWRSERVVDVSSEYRQVLRKSEKQANMKIPDLCDYIK